MQGFNDASSAVTQTIDGVPTNDIWSDMVRAAQIWNDRQGAYVSLLSYRSRRSTELVPQTGTGGDFERASEYGAPKGLRGSGSLVRVGADFDWYDVATRFTWRFLTDATREQVDAVTAEVFAADARLTFNRVVGAIMNNVNRFDDASGATVWPLFNGDGSIPAPYQGNTFDGTTSCYLVSGATTVDPGDVEQMLDKLVTLGGTAAGQQLILLCNKQEGREIRKWRAGSTYGGITANYDFVPSASAPPRITDETILGEVPPDTYQGLDIFGSYADVWLHETSLMEPGYLVLVATGGANSSLNPVMFREHSNPALGGLQAIPGRNQTYPLQESFWRRGFGTGVRRRAGAVVMQIKASGGYAIPAKYVGQ